MDCIWIYIIIISRFYLSNLIHLIENSLYRLLYIHGKSNDWMKRRTDLSSGSSLWSHHSDRYPADRGVVKKKRKRETAWCHTTITHTRGCTLRHVKIMTRALHSCALALTYRCDPWHGMHTPDMHVYVTRGTRGDVVWLLLLLLPRCSFSLSLSLFSREKRE